MTVPVAKPRHGVAETGSVPGKTSVSAVAKAHGTAAEEEVVLDLSQEVVRATTPLREAPVASAALEVAVATAESARTESVMEVVTRVSEAIADQILVTPSLVRGEGEMIVRLKPEVLEGSTIRLSAESGTLSVEIVPATPEVERLATAALPRLETALAEHVAAFHHVTASVKKGTVNETV